MLLWGLVAIGLILLFLGGEALVRGAVNLAARLGVSPLLIGLTIVAFGTSSPELVVSLQAGLKGQPDLAVGNVVGSNIANILLILGVSALIHPLRCRPIVVFRDGTLMVAASIILVVTGYWSPINRIEGILMLAGLIGVILYSYWSERQRNLPPETVAIPETADLAARPMRLWAGVGLVVGGLAALVIGSSALVKGAVGLARAVGVSEAVIGLTLVAVGTSLPELATSAIAAFRRQADVAVGNVIGSNLFNILGILGLTAAVTPVPVHPQIVSFDLWVMLGCALVLLPFLVTGWRLSRIEGGIFLTVYGLYLLCLYLGVPA